MISCLLHGAVVVLPYFGESRKTALVEPGKKTGPAFLATTLARVAHPHRKPLPTPAEVPPQELPQASQAAVPSGDQQETRPDGREVENHGRDASGLPFAGLRYYPASRLTKRPRAIAPIDLDIPEIRGFIASGKVVLILWISDLGLVTEVEVEQSELPGAFAASARSVFSHARFEPGELDGQTVGSIIRIEVTYDDDRLRGG